MRQPTRIDSTPLRMSFHPDPCALSARHVTGARAGFFPLTDSPTCIRHAVAEERILPNRPNPARRHPHLPHA